MGVRSYSDWNSYFLDVFFYKSTPGSFIRFNVSKEWLDAVPARDGMGGYLNFLSAIREETQRRTLYDSLNDMLNRQRMLPMEPPQYVAALVFLCLPWTWTRTTEQIRAHNYWNRLNTMSAQYDIECNSLLKHGFKDLLNTNNGDLLSLLRQWSINCSDVKGEFVYCHLYNDPEDKVSLLRSQVWPTAADLKWMPEVLFCHTDQSKELDDAQLGDFCRRQDNIQYAWTSFRNLFLSNDPLAQNVQKEALSQIYDSYEDWVNEGRPVEKLPKETLRRICDTDESEKRTVTKLPHLWLRLKKKGPAWEKTLCMYSSGFLSEREESEPKIDIEINGRVYVCQLTLLPSGIFLIHGQDELWNNLARVASQEVLLSKMRTVGNFMFSPRKCYVMLPSSSGTFVQQDFASPGQDFWALYSADNKESFSGWVERNNVKTGLEIDIGEGWMLQCVHALDEEQCKLFPNGLVNERESGLFTRLLGGVKARMGASPDRYLREFLPNIEAYLPNGFSVLIQDEYGNSYNAAEVLHEVKDPVNEESPVFGMDEANLYLDRIFSISLPPSFLGSELQFQFQIDGKHYGKMRRVKLAPVPEEAMATAASHAWDWFGNVIPLENGKTYWPGTTEEKLACGLWPSLGQVFTSDGYFNDAYWTFIGQLIQTQGPNGIPAKDFWTIVCGNFRGEEGWKQQIRFLEDLGVLDIQCNEFGLWARFYLNPPALCLLPCGRFHAVLSGAFTEEHVEKLWQCRDAHPDLSVTLSEQRSEGERQALRMLPPHVLVTADSIDTLKAAACECNLAWGGIPALGFACQSASLEEWLKDRQRFLRDGNPRDEDISGWYIFLSYKTQNRQNDRQLQNPLSSCQQLPLFVRCLSIHPCPSIRGFDVFDLVNQKRNTAVYVKDVSWGRWISYLMEDQFEHLRFRIAYHRETGTMVFPEELMPPRVLARALTLCSGRIPRKVSNPCPYDQGPVQGQTPYGLSNIPYQGACLRFGGVPPTIAECVAQKLHAELKDF